MTIDQLKTDIDRNWRVYNESEDDAEIDAAYDEWCRLVGLLDASQRHRHHKDRIRNRE